MRLIDADELKDRKLQAYNDALPEFDMPWKKKVAHAVTLSFMADVDDAPTVDAVPVVRCRECGAFRPLKEGGICWNTGYYVPEDGFCHDGERKGGDE